MHVVVFLRHIPGHVRLVKPEREEEGPVVRLAELGDAKIRDGGVRNRFVAALDGAEGDAADAAVIDLALGFLFFSHGRPLLRPAQSAMPQLADANRVVTRVLELHDQRLRRLEDIDEGLVVVVDSSHAGAPAAQQRGARRIAYRRRAVRVGEGDAHPGQPVQVRRPGLLVAPEMTHPMIQIIHGQKEHVELRRLGGGQMAAPKRHECEERQEELHGWQVRERFFDGDLAAFFMIPAARDIQLPGASFRALRGFGLRLALFLGSTCAGIRLHVSALGPGLPLRGEFFGLAGLRRGEVVQLGAVGLQVVEFPGSIRGPGGRASGRRRGRRHCLRAPSRAHPAGCGSLLKAGTRLRPSIGVIGLPLNSAG